MADARGQGDPTNRGGRSRRRRLRSKRRYRDPGGTRRRCRIWCPGTRRRRRRRRSSCRDRRRWSGNRLRARARWRPRHRKPDRRSQDAPRLEEPQQDRAQGEQQSCDQRQHRARQEDADRLQRRADLGVALGANRLVLFELGARRLDELERPRGVVIGAGEHGYCLRQEGVVPPGPRARHKVPNLGIIACSHNGNTVYCSMQIIARRTLKRFWRRHAQAEKPLRAWYMMVKAASWKGPADVKEQFGNTVDFVADNRLIFDIGGNKFRLVVHVAYRFKRVLVKFIGTHKEYERIDP